MRRFCGLTLSEYGMILDRVIPFEAGWIAADMKYIYLFRKKPVMRQLTIRSTCWQDRDGNAPLLKMTRPPGFPDLGEYIGFDGDTDWYLVCEPVGGGEP